MNSVIPMPFPRWHKVAGALLWELVWKNKVVFPALALFLALGAGLAWARDNAAPDVWWVKYAQGTGGVSFLASLLLAFAPFTLMDNYGSWRMNSVTHRWSTLPVRTLWLVGVPLLAAWTCIGLLVGAWAPILSRLFQGIDLVYILAVFLVGVMAVQALAWAIPRKPGQYWVLAALLFLVLLLGAVIPQDRRDWADVRIQALMGLGATAAVLGLLAVWAAHRNRCGDWPGEIPVTGLWDGLWRPSTSLGAPRSPVAALFWSEAAPACRTFLMSWVALSLLLVGWAWITLWLHRPGLTMKWTLIGLAMLVEALPNFGVLWLMVWALFLGCEPGMGFQTRLSGFRATRPVTAGLLAGMRIGSLVITWLCVWVPLLILQRLYIADDPGMPARMAGDLSRQASELIAGRMVFSASALVAALPVLLWGRMEGFPTVFLVTLVGWLWTWVLSGFAHQAPPPDWLAGALGGLLSVKLAAALWVLLHSYRKGYITWRFPARLLGGWLGAIGSMLWLFPPWEGEGLSAGLGLAVMLPLARLAACPLAMAANRHR